MLKKVLRRALYVIAPIIIMMVQLPFMHDITAYAEPNTITIQALVRDFKKYDKTDPYTNCDFENPVRDMVLTKGLVSASLGSDNKPVFQNSGGGQIHSKKTFDQWYNTINSGDDATSVNKEIPITITLHKDSNTGNYVYDQYDFFPIDNQGFGNQGNEHNYHFTMELHSAFTYEKGSLFLDISGDDDLWVFIDKKLVVDIGGVHSHESSGIIYLDSFGLIPGQTYQFDLFFAERHVTQSDIRLETNIKFKNIDPTVPNYTFTTLEDQPISKSVIAEDLDFGTITYTKGNDPQHGSATVSENGEWTYVPDTNYCGTDSFTVIVDDGDGGSVISTVTIIVEPVNDAPAATADTATVAQDSDTGVVIDVLNNDEDVDGDPLTITAVGKAANGTVAISSDKKTVTYTPDEGFNGTDGFTYTVSDGNGGTATAEVTVTVVPKPVNNPPVAVKDVVEVSEDGSLNINVIENDTDPNGDALTVTAVGNPANGTATINADGTVNYKPNANYNGADEFTYTISDGNGGTATASVYVTVKPVNDAPAATADTATVAQDSDTGVVIDVLNNDEDVDGDPLTITAVGKAANGIVAISSDKKTVTYTPDEGFNGADEFTYTVSDGNGGTATAEVTVTVVPKPVNNPPVAVKDVVEVSEDGSLNINVIENDTDPNGDALTVTAVGNPANGTATINADGTVNYKPNANYNGADEFTYTISDGNGGTATASVYVTVKPVNDAPAATADTATVAQDSDTGVVIDVLNNDEDVDGDPLTITAVGKAANGIVAISSDKKTVTYTPDEGFNGTDGFTYTVSDGNGGTATAEVTVTVVPKPVNNPPVADNKNVETKVNTPISDKITASDPDKNPLSYSKNTDPEHGNVTVETDGSWTYTPNKDYTGKDSFIVIVDDGNGGKTESTVTITVNPKQQPTSSSPSPAPVSSNHNPVVPDYTSFTEVNKPVGGRVIATDSDKDTLLYSLLTVPRKGQVSVKSNGEWTYTPDTGYIGEDLFQVTVSDGKGGTAVSKISIEVEAIPLGSSKDVAVVIRVDKIMIEEYGEGKFTIAYYNKLESTVSNTVVSVLLPEGTIANNYGNGVLNENEIQWNIGNLQPRAKGQLSFNLSFGKIDTPQEIVDIEAAITSTDKLITPEDDKSLISVLIYSQEQGTKHQRYMQGYPDGLFGPDKPITREEIAAILARILELEAEGQEEQIYGDVSLDRWSAEYIDAVTDAKLFIGSSDGNFYPEASITRAELASVIARYLKVEMAKGVVPQEYHYNDIEGHWAASSIEEILRFGVLLGNDDGKFDPDKTMTRKEAVIMMNRMFFRGPLTGTKTIWEDVPEDMPGWEDILEATISHESTYTKDQSELFMKKTADPAWQK